MTWKRWFLQSPKHRRYSDADYLHAEIVCNDLKIRNLGEYHDLYA